MDYDEVQKIYHSVCSGYDEIRISSEKCFFKHVNYADKIVLKNYYSEGLDIAKKNGVKTEEEYLKFYIEKKWWSKEKESQIAQSRVFIENLIKTKSKLMLPSQRGGVQKTIDEEVRKINKILTERKSIIPTTAEEYAEKYYHRYYLNNLLFKDVSFSIPVSDNNDYFDCMEDDIYDQLWIQISKILDLLKIDNLKYVAATGFFQNLILLTGSDFPIYNFYGKPITQLTTYQIDIFSYASTYRKMINNTTEKISDEILSDPSKLVGWCEGGSSSSKARKSLDKSPNQKNSRGERSGRITSLVGAKKADYEEIGMNSQLDDSNLLETAQNKGGELNIYDTIKATESKNTKK